MFEKFEDFKAGRITEEAWRELCKVKLEKMLLENVDVFKRLKDR